jgi:acyl carrier protein
MTEQETTGLVVDLICRQRHLDPSQVSETTNLREDLGFDSLDAAELLTALHKETGRHLGVDSMADVTTVGDLVRGVLASQDHEGAAR